MDFPTRFATLRHIGRDKTKHASLVALLLALVLLRKRLLGKAQPRLSPDELARETQKLYEVNKDGSKTLLVPFRGRVAKVEMRPTPPETLLADARHFPPVPPEHKPGVDRVFLRQLRAILRLAFPALASKEALIVLLHSLFLVLRTVLSVGVAKLDGRIVRDLVSGDGPGFLRGLGWWFAFALPSTYTNAMLRHLQSKLALRLRTRLTRYTHDLYLSSAPSLRYYRISQPGGLEGVDQYITSDIAAFCESLSALYGNIMKPTLDMFIFTAQLARVLGVRGTVLLTLNYYVTVRILRAVTPAFGRLAAVEAMLEGEYRAGMSRVGRESEEVAFYAGGARERTILWNAYLRLVKHINSIYKLRIAYEWTEDFVIKYLWSAAGYGLISIPVLFTRTRTVGVQVPTSAEGLDNAVADRTENYISSRRLLLSLADAGGRLMYAYKDVLELAGYTTRLYTLLSTLHALPTSVPFTSSPDTISMKHLDIGVPVPPSAQSDDASSSATYNDDEDNMILVRDLSFELKVGVGEHLMITGTNGVGKTAVARVVAGLWAGRVGELVRPPLGESEVFVVPQRAYMVPGTLLDQVIYPHSFTQFLQSGRTETELLEVLKAVHLAYLPEREGGWSTRKEWRDVLSGGEKQRMGLARAFYHRPKFAVLDECTSAVSSDVEGSMYQHAKGLGITLITISLRPSLAKYHTYQLTLHGPGASADLDLNGVAGETGTATWKLTRVGTAAERMERDREVVHLEARLAEVETWERRVRELDVLLSTPAEV
ncbi:ABC transporter transmembrane region 2-domain-containing protein [Phellopilus nigrolimitatus]|nr:ABC transporter transmembrane region 2-domain-containing protein [Phellopilus nigrolimitatus]